MVIVLVSIISSLVVRRYCYPPKDRRPIDYFGTAVIALMLGLLFLDLVG